MLINCGDVTRIRPKRNKVIKISVLCEFLKEPVTTTSQRVSPLDCSDEKGSAIDGLFNI